MKSPTTAVHCASQFILDQCGQLQTKGPGATWRRPVVDISSKHRGRARSCSLTQSSCLTCETQNCFYSAANCLKTINIIRHSDAGQNVEAFPLFQGKKKTKKLTFFHKMCQAKLKRCINQSVASEILHLFWRSTAFYLNLWFCVEQLGNILYIRFALPVTRWRSEQTTSKHA